MNFASVDELTQQSSQLRKLVSTRRELLAKLDGQYQRSFKILRNIELPEQQLVANADEYSEFLDGQLL